MIDNKYGYRGVKRKPGRRLRPFYARIKHNNEIIHSEACFTAEEAARAYDVMARIYHGGRAVLNFPPQRRRNPIIDRLEAAL